MRNLKLSDYSEEKNSPEPQSEKITKLGLTMPKTKGKYDKLIEAIPDLEEAIDKKEIGIHPFSTSSKRPREIDGESHNSYWQKQLELDRIKRLGPNTNIGFTMGYDPENKGHHLAVIDIDGFKKFEDGKDNREEYWYDDEIHRKSCELLFNILKEINVDFIVCCSWSGGYHLYYKSYDSIITSDVDVLKYLKYPENWEIEELRGKAINGELGEGVEILAKENSKMVVTHPSRINETKTNPITGKKETRTGQYKLLEEVNYIRELKPVDKLSNKIKDAFINYGFIFDEKSYNNRHKEKEKLKKSINNTPPIAIKDPEITEELINNIMPFYTQGSMDEFGYKLSGFLRKNGMSKEFILQIFEQLPISHDLKKVRAWVENIFKTDIDKTAGWTALSEHIINSSATEEEKTGALEYFNSLRNKQPKTLPKELKDEGWILKGSELLIPYLYRPDWWNNDNNKLKDNEYYYSVERVDGKKQYSISWKVKEPKSDIYAISESFETDKFINVMDDIRNRKLGENANNYNLPREKGSIKDFWGSLPPILNKHKIKDILNDNYSINKERTEPEDDEFKVKYKSFDDYSEDIQEEAKKEVKEDKVFDNILKSVSIDHTGNQKAIKTDLCAMSTVYLKCKPVNTISTDESGEGKTSRTKSTVKNFPYIHIGYKRSYSSKSNFFIKPKHPKFCIYILDDFIQSIPNIESAKQLADTEEKILEHQTVNKNEAGRMVGEILEISVKRQVNINSAKQIEDAELNNRCLRNNPKKDETHKKSVFNKILENEGTNVNDSEILNRMRLINQASIHYLSELYDEGMVVFNPYLILLSSDNIAGGRTLTHMIGLIKGRSFYSHDKRRKIDGVVIGSDEDMLEVMDIWKSSELENKYKLHPKQVEILKIVLNYSRDETVETIPEKIEYTLDNYDEPDSEKKTKISLKYLKETYQNNKTKAKKEGSTKSNIARKLGESKSTVDNWIYGSKTGTQLGLVEVGLLDKIPFDEEKSSEGILFFINEEALIKVEDLISGKPLDNDNYFENSYDFSTLSMKKRLLNDFLTLLSYVKNNNIQKYIHDFCSEDKRTLDNYDDICDFIEDFMIGFKEKGFDKNDLETLNFDDLYESFSNTYEDEV